jgi:hypothetical protein
MIRLWTELWPDATNTGILCRTTPALDIDIYNEEAARAVEDLVREKYEERGWLLVRVGKPPKRAVIFFTDSPFKKITVPLTAPNGRKDEKLEMLASGQQLVIHGDHPDTGQAYRWHGGEPWTIARTELPYIREDEARALIDDAATLLSTAFGYTRTAAAPKSNGIRPGGGGEAAWKFHFDNVLHGRALHDSLRDLAAMLAATGMGSGHAVHLLAAWLELSEASHDERWDARYRGIGPAVDSAYAKYRK